MRFIPIKLKDLKFKKNEYSEELKTSIINVGISIPIRVSIKDNEYLVLDGNKRCSVIADYFDEEYEITSVLVDDFTSSGSNYWGNRNHH